MKTTILCLFAFAGVAHATILVEDRFIDGGFTNGTDALDLKLQLYTNVRTLSIVNDNVTGPNEGGNDNALNINVSGQGFRGVVGILSAPVTLSIGDQLTLTYDHKFSGSGNTSAAIRYGLYNQNGTSAPTNDFGYFSRVSTGTGSPAIEAWKETGADVVLSGADTSLLAGGSGSGFVGVTTASVNLGIILTRTGASSMLVELTQDGSTVWSVTDSSSSYFTYDVIALGTGTNTSNYSLDNIILTYTAIPEPGTIVLVAISLGSLFLLRRRR